MALIAISCSCGHVGLVRPDTLPRLIKCSACGHVRHVARTEGAKVRGFGKPLDEIARTRSEDAAPRGVSCTPRHDRREGIRQRAVDQAWRRYNEGGSRRRAARAAGVVVERKPAAQLDGRAAALAAYLTGRG